MEIDNVVTEPSEVALTKAEAILHKFGSFTDGVRVLFLIYRSKEGATKANNSKLKVYWTRNEDELKQSLARLIMLKDSSELPLRIQMSVNQRNVEKAIRNFKQNMLDNDYNPLPIKHDFFMDIRNRWVSSLMKPSARAETFFLIDADTQDEYDAVIAYKLPIVLEYKTKNGWHFIVPPYNPNLTPDIKDKINKDGLLLLDF